jgi:hypothetical protein
VPPWGSQFQPGGLTALGESEISTYARAES